MLVEAIVILISDKKPKIHAAKQNRARKKLVAVR
jgi:hypothetical protein